MYHISTSPQTAPNNRLAALTNLANHFGGCTINTKDYENNILKKCHSLSKVLPSPAELEVILSESVPLDYNFVKLGKLAAFENSRYNYSTKTESIKDLKINSLSAKSAVCDNLLHSYYSIFVKNSAMSAMVDSDYIGDCYLNNMEMIEYNPTRLLSRLMTAKSRKYAGETLSDFDLQMDTKDLFDIIELYNVKFIKRLSRLVNANPMVDLSPAFITIDYSAMTDGLINLVDLFYHPRWRNHRCRRITRSELFVDKDRSLYSICEHAFTWLYSLNQFQGLRAEISEFKDKAHHQIEAVLNNYSFVNGAQVVPTRLMQELNLANTNLATTAISDRLYLNVAKSSVGGTNEAKQFWEKLINPSYSIINTEVIGGICSNLLLRGDKLLHDVAILTADNDVSCNEFISYLGGELSNTEINLGMLNSKEMGNYYEIVDALRLPSSITDKFGDTEALPVSYVYDKDDLVSNDDLEFDDEAYSEECLDRQQERMTDAESEALEAGIPFNREEWVENNPISSEFDSRHYSDDSFYFMPSSKRYEMLKNIRPMDELYHLNIGSGRDDEEVYLCDDYLNTFEILGDLARAHDQEEVSRALTAINKGPINYAPDIYLGSILLTNQPDKCYHELSHRVIRCLLTNDYLNLDNFVETMKYAEAMGSVGRIFALEMAEVKDRILETTKSKTKAMLCACSDIVISESILF